MKSEHLTQNKVKTEDSDFAHIEVIDKTIIRLHVLSPVPGARLFKDIDLSQFWLPPTTFAGGVTSLASRPDLVEAVIKIVLSYVARNGYSHETPRTLISLSLALAKLFEYLWLKGCYRISDIRPYHFEHLPQELSIGGWSYALRALTRTEAVIAQWSPEQLCGYLSVSKSRGGKNYGISSIFRQKIGTNLRGVELVEMHSIVYESLKISSEIDQRSTFRVRPSAVVGMGIHGIRRELDIINKLADESESPLIGFTPFCDVGKIAVKLGRPSRRTNSLRPQDVGKLLAESFRQIDQIGPSLTNVIADIQKRLAAIMEFRGKIRSREVFVQATEAVKQSDLEARVGAFINPRTRSQLGSEHLSLGQIIRTVTSACFVIIALLNGRRKGEVESPIFGLREGSLRLVDKKLGIYECDFYIEKTYRNYMTFYVGDATVRAIKILEKLSKNARLLLQIHKNNSVIDSQLDVLRPLFQMPYLKDTRYKGKPSWFSFGSVEKCAGHELVSKAFGGEDIQLTAHMFRRAYALIFYYRYEDSDLLSLKQQLGHLDIEMTRIYVTWGAEKSIGGTLRDYGKLSPEQVNALRTDARGIKKEFETVSKERIQDYVEAILSKRPGITGGFTRLIQRFHQRLGSRIEYQLKDTKKQQEEVAAFVLQRGHGLVPFKHGNCLAAPGKKNRGAGCYSSETDHISREHASPTVCGKCPYHILGVAHLRSMMEDELAMEAQLRASAQNTVSAMRAAEDLSNLKKLVNLYQSRLNVPKVNASQL
ncbi:hypothetical protein ABE501_00025 [Comamonas testosteroni]